jgi:hypothetical protein
MSKREQAIWEAFSGPLTQTPPTLPVTLDETEEEDDG